MERNRDPGGLTLDEAAARYNFPLDRLRRRVLQGGIPDAFQVTIGDHTEWRIPVGSLEALGYAPRGTARHTPVSSANGQAVSPLPRIVFEPRREPVPERDISADLARIAAKRTDLDAEREKLRVRDFELAQKQTALFAEQDRVARDRESLEQFRLKVLDEARRVKAEAARLRAARDTEVARLAALRGEIERLKQEQLPSQ